MCTVEGVPGSNFRLEICRFFFTETGQNRQFPPKTPFFRKELISQSAQTRTILQYTLFEAEMKVTQENRCERRAKPG